MITCIFAGILSVFPLLWTEIVQYSRLIPDCRVMVDYGVPADKPVTLVFYALPNGNSIEWTAGKKMQPGDDWHYDIQHIRAQSEFIRQADTTRYYVVAYLEAGMKAWTAHAARYNGVVTEQNPSGLHSYILYPKLVDTLSQLVAAKTGKVPQQTVLASHSGGGRFMFDYLAGVAQVPPKITRLAFLDSTYGFEDALHTAKLGRWLKSSAEHKLVVLAYVDTTVIFNGKRIVSDTGGTGYKTEQMRRMLEEKEGFAFAVQADTCLKEMRSGNIVLLKKENPQGNIYHTVLVERNGLIHALFVDTPLEERGYCFWREGRSYDALIPERIFSADQSF